MAGCWPGKRPHETDSSAKAGQCWPLWSRRRRICATLVDPDSGANTQARGESMEQPGPFPTLKTYSTETPPDRSS